jgi:hypothetical protein
VAETTQSTARAWSILVGSPAGSGSLWAREPWWTSALDRYSTFLKYRHSGSIKPFRYRTTNLSCWFVSHCWTTLNLAIGLDPLPPMARAEVPLGVDAASLLASEQPLASRSRWREQRCLLGSGHLCSFWASPTFSAVWQRPQHRHHSGLASIANRSSFLSSELVLGKLSETVVVVGNAPHDRPRCLVCHLIATMRASSARKRQCSGSQTNLF